MKTNLISIILIGILTLPIFGWSQDSLYLEGVAYLKVKDASTVELEPYDYSIPDLNQIISDYNITSFQSTFETPDLALQKIYRVEFSNTAQVNDMILDLNALTFLDYAEKAPKYYLNAVPNDYDPGMMWHLAKISAPMAWDISAGNSNVSVAILDNAVSYQHEDLVPNAWQNPGEIAGNGLDDDLNGYTDDIYGYDVADGDNNPAPPLWVNNGNSFIHGTHCAGIASAATDNGIGVASIGHDVSIIAVKCTRNQDSGRYLTHAYEGLDYAISAGADIVSMSFGSQQQFITWNYLISSASAREMVLIAAAGNDNSSQPFYPAGYNSVLAVGATTQSDTKASFSNYGSWVDVMAPGVSIYSTLSENNNTYGNASGTSMSCPLVAGLAGLLRSVDNSLTADEVKTALKDGCDNIDALNPGYAGQLGAGRINAHSSLALVNPPTALYPQNTQEITIYPNPASEILFLVLPSEINETVSFELYDNSGKLVLSQQIAQPGYSRSVLDINHLKSGNYVARIMTGSELYFKNVSIVEY